MEKFNPVAALENARTSESEIKLLETLRGRLVPKEESKRYVNVHEESDLDAEWLNNSSSNYGELTNPFPNNSPENIFKDQEQLNWFTFYLFERRYGWSEHVSHTELSNAGKVVPLRPDSRSGRCSGSLNVESKLKGRLNELLDDFLKWYLCQSNLSEKLLQSLTHAVTRASSFPVVRNQTVVHILEWLKTMARKGFDSSTFSLVKNFIVAGLTDIWSAIRNACAARLAKIIDSFTIRQLEYLFVELEQICQSKSSSWQAKEGAVMGLTAIIRSFHLSNLPTNSDSFSSPKFKMFVKFGKECLPKLPEFITDSLYSVVFSLLAHPQLSIREHASKAFTSILSRSESQYINKSFQQVIIRLCKDTGVDISCQSYEKLPHHAVLREEFTFLDAYEAQGLLEVSVFLIKRIPVNLLMEHWPLYFSTFNLYLMHPASTVRQASSVVFKYLVTKDSSSPSILRLVLQCLCENWETTPDTVSDSVGGDHSTDANKMRCSSQDFSACNHVCNDSQSYLTGNIGTASRCKRPSIKLINKLMREHDKQRLDPFLSSTWEWREGRLLAYELILKYLIANHIHYVFPSYAFSYSARNASCSVDEAVLKRTRGLYGHHAVQTFSGSDSTSSSSLPASSSIDVLEESQNVSGRSSAPGTRKEKDETLNSTNCELESRPRIRTSSFTKQEEPEHSRRLFRQRTVGVLPSKTHCAPMYQKNHKTYFADSLLNRAKTMDQQENESMKTKKVCEAYERLTKETGTTAQWMTLLDYDSIYGILTQVLYQTMECLGDSRWELRRMGQQILPLITETIRWFDITILEDFWSKYLSRNSLLFCYSGCIALKYSISHAGKLRQFIDQPPATWKDIESCCSSAMNVFRSVDNGLQLWIPKIVSLLRDISTYDKITVSAMEVLMTRQLFLPQDSRLKEKHFIDALICDVIIFLFLKAHPDSPCASSLRNSPMLHVNKVKPILFPSDEFLSICSKTVTLLEQARQAERFLVLELHNLCVSFFGGCRFDIQIAILPVLVHSIYSFCGDTDISHSLVLSIMKVADRLQERKGTKNNDGIDEKDVKLFLDLAIWEFSFLITQRSIDLAVLKQLQEIFLIIFKHIDRPGHIKDVLQAVSTRLNYEPDLVRLMDEENDDVPLSELQFLSNDIPTSPVSESPLLQEDEDDIPDDSVDRVIHESLALNASHDSLANGSNSGHGREETGADSDDAFSDWDSIEEPLIDNAREALGEFVNHLWMLFQQKGNGYFEQELKKCGQAEEMIIQSIVESFQ